MSDIDDIVKKYQDRILNSAKFATTVFTTKVISRTPKDKGDLIASWNPKIGDPEADNIYVSAGDTKRHDVVGTINSMKLGDKFSLANGQPYAPRIEYEGYSPQAVSGMVGPTLLEWQQIVTAAARKATRGS